MECRDVSLVCLLLCISTNDLPSWDHVCPTTAPTPKATECK
jgi:hypothetical protein